MEIVSQIGNTGALTAFSIHWYQTSLLAPDFRQSLRKTAFKIDQECVKVPSFCRAGFISINLFNLIYNVKKQSAHRGVELYGRHRTG